jgi:hypothetical protein
VVGEDDEGACFQHVAEMLYNLVDGKQLAVVCSVFLLGWVKFLGEGEGCQAFWTCCCSIAPMADVEASVTSANGNDGWGVPVKGHVTNSPSTFRRP